MIKELEQRLGNLIRSKYRLNYLLFTYFFSIRSKSISFQNKMLKEKCRCNRVSTN